MTDLRIGVLGVGRIGKMHAELIERQTPGATVSAVYDVYTEGAGAVGADVDARVASSPGDLIGADDVDAVAICSSTDTHVDLLVAAAEAGKAVFIEKPLSLDLAEVDRGVAAVEAAGIPVQVGFNRRFDPSHKAVRDQVLAGAVGDAGDLDTVVIVMTHENGAITTIDNSRQAVYGYDQRVEVFGSAGLVSSDNPRVNTTTLRTADGSSGSTIPYFFLDRYIPSYLAEWSEFVAMVTEAAASPVTVRDGRAPLIIGLAAWQSYREGRPVKTAEITA